MGLTPQKKRSELSQGERGQNWGHYLDGYSNTEISRKTGIPRTTIGSFIRRTIESGDITFKNKLRTRRLYKTNSRSERALLRTATNDIRMTLKSLATPLKLGYKLNHYTVAKILKRHRKVKRRPRKKPYLNNIYKRKRTKHYKDEKALLRDNRRVY